MTQSACVAQRISMDNQEHQWIQVSISGPMVLCLFVCCLFFFLSHLQIPLTKLHMIIGTNMRTGGNRSLINYCKFGNISENLIFANIHELVSSRILSSATKNFMISFID